MKIGRRSALEEFVRKSERSKTLVGKLRPSGEVPDNLLVIDQDKELMLRLDSAFFRVAESRGGLLLKYQREDERLPSVGEVRKRLKSGGPDVARLEGPAICWRRSSAWSPWSKRAAAACRRTSIESCAWA